MRTEEVTREESVMTVNQNDGEQSDKPPPPTTPPPPSTTVTPWKDPFEYEEIRGGKTGQP
jgi:hypothetical protein